MTKRPIVLKRPIIFRASPENEGVSREGFMIEGFRDISEGTLI